MAEPFTAITAATQLEAYGVPAPINRGEVLTVLEDVHREWLEATPLVFVATASRDGRWDVSPRGDLPGFVRVLSPTRIAIPERSGNRRMDGFHNILENPHVGLVCLIPGRRDTLRINGTAVIVSDLPDFDAMVVRGHRPPLALVLDVEEVFFHADTALALWGRGETEDDVRQQFPVNVEVDELYPANGPYGATS